MKAQCSNCRFYEPPVQAVPDLDHPTQENPRGSCRRRGWMLPQGHGFLRFGAVSPSTWCGEWEEGKRLSRVGTDYAIQRRVEESE